MMFQYDTVATEAHDIWSRLAAPVPHEAISWRKDGSTVARDGRFYARFVAYIEANTVRERLDSVVPGEWDLLLELLPTLPASDGEDGPTCAFRARLQVRGVMREDVGMGKDYKQAATDAFKRAAVRFGVAHELYAYDVNWVEMDGDGRYAKPKEDPATAYERRRARREERQGGSDEPAVAPPSARAPIAADGGRESAPNADSPSPRRSSAASRLRARAVTSSDIPSCPKCSGPMWDNRPTKRNPNAPDFRCRNKSCDAVIWPTRLVPVGERTSTGTDDVSAPLSLGGAADAADAL